MTVENPFATTGAGALYARGRPYHHPATLGRVFEIVGADRVEAALDVACGTGLSTAALAERAESVVACELSGEMLAAVPRAGNIAYVRSAAERLPIARARFDAVTVASAVHWLDQDRFFAEAHRVLRPGGWIALYDHYFLASLRDDAASEAWGQEFSTRYPLPPRNRSTGEKALAPPAFFEPVADDHFDNDQEMTHDALVDYVLSQSNAIAANQRGEPVRAWVTETTAPFFAGASTRTVRFLSVVTCWRAR